MYSKIPMIRQHCLHVYFFFGCDEQLLNKLKWDRLFDIGGPSSIQRRQPDLSSPRRELIRILNRMVCPALPCPCWVAINSNICTFSPSASSCPLAHCCTIFLKSSGYGNIDDRHRNPNINIKEIIWLGNQLPAPQPSQELNIV